MDNNNTASDIALDPSKMAPQDSSPLVQTGSTQPAVLDITPRDNPASDAPTTPIAPVTPIAPIEPVAPVVATPTPDPLIAPASPSMPATPVPSTIATPTPVQSPLAEDPNAVNTIG